MPNRWGWFLVLVIANGLLVRGWAETVDADSVVRYVLSCRKSDGAFGPASQRYSQMAWTFPAVQILRTLGQSLSDPERCLAAPQDDQSVRPYQALLERTLLEKDLCVASLLPHGQTAPPVSFRFQSPNDPRNPAVFRLTPTEITYHDLESLQLAMSAMLALDRRMEDQIGLINFVRSSQSPAGHFFSHVAPTAHAIRIHEMLKVTLPLQRQCILWLRACQAPEGGFRFSPDDPSSANRPDIRYTHDALSALSDLGAAPAHPQACIDWINTLQNADGGFGDQPGLPSRLVSTQWAVQSLQLLTGNARSAIRPKTLRPFVPQSLPEGLSLFQACMSVPLPSLEDLQRLGASRVNLFFIPGPVNRPHHQRLSGLVEEARTRSLPLSFVAAAEWSASRLRFPDQTVADHRGFFCVQPAISETDWSRFASRQWSSSSPMPWNDFVSNLLSSWKRFPAFVVLDTDCSPMLAYRLFDESLVAPMGYSALVAFDAAGRDRIRANPDLERWIGRLAFVPTGPLHGHLAEWLNDPVQARVLFWAKSFHLADFLDATRDGLSVCVVRNPRSPEGVVYYGRGDLVERLKVRADDWRWWKSRPDPVLSFNGDIHE